MSQVQSMDTPFRSHAVVIGCLLTAGCSEKDTVANKQAIEPMLGAVMHAKTDEVRRLADRGIGLDERYYTNNDTPMIFAAGSNQWTAVEILIDHGADIWAYNQFGITAAQRTETSRVIPGSDEDQARLRVIAKLKARGYPFPPPKSDEVLEMVKEGLWPPAGARS